MLLNCSVFIESHEFGTFSVENLNKTFPDALLPDNSTSWSLCRGLFYEMCIFKFCIISIAIHCWSRPGGDKQEEDELPFYQELMVEN